jgi:putative ABC transport system permease protein
MLFKKLLRTMGQYKAQFISMIIMIALGIGVFVGFNMEWVSIEENTSKFFSDTRFADYRVVSEEGFSSEDLAAISAADGVLAASRFISVDTAVKGVEDRTIALTVTENPEVSFFTVTSGDEYDETDAQGLWLSDQYASKNKVKKGDEITLTFNGFDFTFTVRGFIKSGEYMICTRDETQIMPDLKKYAFAYISPTAYLTKTGMAYYPQINVRSSLSKTAFTETANAAFGKTYMILSRDETISYSESQGEAKEGKTMGSIVPVLFLAIAVLTMVTTMHRLTAKEKTQIGTLKALGFKNRRILFHYTSYALFIGLVGTVLGTGLGYLIAWIIMNPDGMMGTYFDMPEWKLYMPLFCVLIMLGILVVLTLIGFLSTRRMLSPVAADALRPYVPRKVKPLLIEKTKSFHKLPFGTRWNLRDIFRHKARTGMSLLGIVGCMVIIVAVMAMNDTINAFLKTYYDDAMNYSSRIYIAQTATDAERSKLISDYDGDWSASVPVELNAKAVSLDVFSVNNDKYRFIGDDDRKKTLSDDGAYVCKRLAKEFGLSYGSTVTIKPYGTDESYTLKIIGVLRSVTENVVMTASYADSLNIKYKPDSVYTSATKSDVVLSAAIKSVQSKSEIIETFDSFMGIMITMIVVFIVAAVLLGIVVLYNLGIMSYTERYREMATLKVLGFKDKKIGALMISQNLWVTVVGMIVGFPLGLVVLDYLIAALASEYEMGMVVGALTAVVSITLTLGVSLLVSLMVARKNKKIDMVEALKSE